MRKDVVGPIVVLVLALVISAFFLVMIRPFLTVILLAGIFAAMFHPLYRRFERWTHGRRAVSSLLTMTVILLAVILPVAGLVGIMTRQAIAISDAVTPWVREQLARPDRIDEWLVRLPFYERVEPYRDAILQKAGELVGGAAAFLIDNLQAATAGTVQFLFLLFVFLYTMFFFLMDGGALLRRILYYLPLEDQAEERMLERFTSVTRATLKGTAVIGVLQGGLAGLAFWVVGIEAFIFWGAIMAVLSIIPAVGAALVWGPAVVILASSGAWGKAIGLGIWCAAVVSSVDNVVRPRLVGHDTQLHDLLILFSTLGGLMLFGVAGFIIGPIVAALFVVIWDIYGAVFSEVLPSVHGWRPDVARNADAPHADGDIETLRQRETDPAPAVSDPHHGGDPDRPRG
ncbi:MAG: AI-2E family transporter [Candidatus Krumholzibacteriia bacterium]